MINCLCKKQSGFTLAEVLITLLIIGVVSAIVIPSVINDTQNAEFKTGWKKAYSDINQATLKIMSDNGGTIKGAWSNDYSLMRDKYLEQLSNTKKCLYGQIVGNCWSDQTKLLDGTLITSETPYNNIYIGYGTGGIINNGVFITFLPLSASCSYTLGGPGLCGLVRIDVNGFKTPNTWGKDIFAVWILENRTLPIGTKYVDYWGNTCSTTGVGCSVEYLYQ